jgi:hypothetical protein
MNKIFVNLLVMFFIVGCSQKDVSNLKTEEQMKKEYRAMTLTHFMKLNKKEILKKEGNTIAWKKFSNWKYNKVEKEITFPLNEICYGQYNGSIAPSSTLYGFIPNILLEEKLDFNKKYGIKFYPCIVSENHENNPFGYLVIDKYQKDESYLYDVYLVESSDDLSMQLKEYYQAYKEKLKLEKKEKKKSYAKSRAKENLRRKEVKYKRFESPLERELERLVKRDYPTATDFSWKCQSSPVYSGLPKISKILIGCRVRMQLESNGSDEMNVNCTEMSGVYYGHTLICK